MTKTTTPSLWMPWVKMHRVFLWEILIYGTIGLYLAKLIWPPHAYGFLLFFPAVIVMIRMMFWITSEVDYIPVDGMTKRAVITKMIRYKSWITFFIGAPVFWAWQSYGIIEAAITFMFIMSSILFLVWLRDLVVSAKS